MLSSGPQLDDGYNARIANWSIRHDLTPDEILRLKAVLTDYPPDTTASELLEELRCILAARKLATMPELTTADVDRARFAFESGLVPFVRQDVDD
jgi:hypothetical protein